MADDTSYVVPFDEQGTCIGPDQLEAVLAECATATDVFLFSHGWNNSWADAVAAYTEFIACFRVAREAHWDPPGREFRPALAGVHWPSAILVRDDEDAPRIAGGEPPGEAVDQGAVEDRLPPGDVERFRELMSRPRLAADEVDELAAMLAPALAGEDDDLDGAERAPSPEVLKESWASLAGAELPERPQGGFVDDEAVPGSAVPETAGLFGISPRDILRMTTVLLMKDRAGRVGARGVAGMLRRVAQANPRARIHLVGHSYGCKVLLSALCAEGAPTVDSVLLLQPAVSARCFADDADDGRPGGYRAALSRSRQPILLTYSARDVALTKLFHWACRRKSDILETPAIAGGPPSKYAALGGYGPQRLPDGVAKVVAPSGPPARYESPGGERVLAIRADTIVSGHGDVKNAATAWALLSQVMG